MKNLKFNKKWSEMNEEEKLLVAGHFKEAKTDKDFWMRYIYYSHNGYNDKDAKKDPHWFIRLQYYEYNGFKDKDAKTDEDEDVRLAYYKHNGFDEDTLKDECHFIREQAKIFLRLLETNDK